MVVSAVLPQPAISSASAPRRRRVIVAAVFAGACAAFVLGAIGAGLAVSRARAPLAREDRVFEAMVAAPIIAIEAEAAPPFVVVAPAALPRPRRVRSTAIAAPPAKAPPAVAPPRAAAALPKEAMPPPFASVD